MAAAFLLVTSAHAFLGDTLPIWSESPSCPFDCLALASNGAQLSQIGNCGCDCTSGIEPAKDGKARHASHTALVPHA